MFTATQSSSAPTVASQTVHATATSLADLAVFRIDFVRWFERFPRRDRRIIRHLAAGNRTDATAERFGVSAARISQLRRVYEQSWTGYQGGAAA